MRYVLKDLIFRAVCGTANSVRAVRGTANLVYSTRKQNLRYRGLRPLLEMLLTFQKKSLRITYSGDPQREKAYRGISFRQNFYIHSTYSTFCRLQHTNPLRENNLLIIYNATAMISAGSGKDSSYARCQLRFSYLWLLGVQPWELPDVMTFYSV